MFSVLRRLKMNFLLSFSIFTCSLKVSSASINVYSHYDRLITSLDDTPTQIGPLFPYNGIHGNHVILSTLNDPCSITPPDPPSSIHYWFAVVPLNKTCYYQQICNLQDAGYKVVILFDKDLNDDDDSSLDTLITSNESKKKAKISIASTFIGNTTYRVLKRFNGNINTTTVIYATFSNLNELVLILLATLCLSIVIALLISVLIFACIRLYKRRSCLITRWRLRFSPPHTFTKGDDYECCVICLDEYLEGERLRVLSCGHAFHSKCVDPWLIKKEQECPLCKRKADLKKKRTKHIRGTAWGNGDERLVEEVHERTSLLTNTLIDAHLEDQEYEDFPGLINTLVISTPSKSYGAVSSIQNVHKVTTSNHLQPKKALQKTKNQKSVKNQKCKNKQQKENETFESLHKKNQPPKYKTNDDDEEEEEDINFYIGSMMDANESLQSNKVSKIKPGDKEFLKIDYPVDVKFVGGKIVDGEYDEDDEEEDGYDDDEDDYDDDDKANIIV